MKDRYLIDGYNVINNWQEFAGIRDADLEHARNVLVSKVMEFSAFHGCEASVVFDAMDVAGPETEETAGSCTVVYTAEHETADSWIERQTYQISRQGFRVFVVTSDRAEQDSILGSGGFRISAREFRDIFNKTKKQIEEKVAGLAGSPGRRELAGRIDNAAARCLEQIRRK